MTGNRKRRCNWDRSLAGAQRFEALAKELLKRERGDESQEWIDLAFACSDAWNEVTPRWRRQPGVEMLRQWMEVSEGLAAVLRFEQWTRRLRAVRTDDDLVRVAAVREVVDEMRERAFRDKALEDKRLAAIERGEAMLGFAGEPPSADAIDGVFRLLDGELQVRALRRA